MKRKWMIILVLGLSIGLLSGCGDLEDILAQIFSDNNDQNNEQVENNQVEEIIENNDDEEEVDNDVVNNANDNDSDSSELLYDTENLFFDERLIEQGYSLTTLPNGFPFSVPYHWVLVEHNIGDASAQGFEGMFCYYLPLDPPEVADVIASLNEANFTQVAGEGDILHSTEFYTDYGYGDDVKGIMNYVKDEYDNSCVEMTYEYTSEEMQGGVANQEDIEIPSFNDTNSYIVEDRTRSVPSDYETDFYERLELSYDMVDMGSDNEDIESIEEKIKNDDYQMAYHPSGYPKIIPYEWFLMDNSEIDGSSAAETYCTDLSISHSILKFHSLLEAHNADILDYHTNGSPSMNSKSTVEFAFNDEFGTGSWLGHANFHIDRLNYFQTHKCVSVIMDFSSERLD